MVTSLPVTNYTPCTIYSDLNIQPCIPPRPRYKPLGICRVALCFLTLGISEAAIAINTFCKVKKYDSDPKIQKNIQRLTNHTLVTSMLDPNQHNQSFPNAIENALKCTNEDFNGITEIECPDKVIKQSLMNIQKKIPRIEDTLTEEYFTKLLTEEIKVVTLEDIAVGLIQCNLYKSGIDNVNPSPLLALVQSKRSKFTKIIQQPNSMFPTLFEEMVKQLTSQAQHHLFTSTALNNAKKECHILTKKFNSLVKEYNELILTHSLFKDLSGSFELIYLAESIDYNEKKKEIENKMYSFQRELKSKATDGKTIPLKDLEQYNYAVNMPVLGLKCSITALEDKLIVIKEMVQKQLPPTNQE